MDFDDMVVNITYIMYVVAPLVRDELKMRVFLAIASVGFATWGLLIDSPWVVFWNVVFILMSARNILRIVRERRPVTLAPRLEAIRSGLFSEMSGRQFERFWAMGEDQHAVDLALTTRGEKVDHFWVFLDGDLRVRLSGDDVMMPSNSTIGGMSYVMGGDVPATASVHAVDAHLRRWDKLALRSLAITDQELNAPFLSGVGRGLVSKIRS